MNAAYIVGSFDAAELAFLLFFGFFVALVFYLNKESRREGYPLEDEDTGKIHPNSLFDGELSAPLVPEPGAVPASAARVGWLALEPLDPQPLPDGAHPFGDDIGAPVPLGRDLARYDRSIDVHVSNLRHKLGLLPDGRSPIQTVRGAGFQLLVA